MKLQAGKQVPQFAIQDVAGREINNEQFKGKKIYMTFLRNTACPLCSFHIFRLLKIAEQLREKNVEILVFYESRKQFILSSPFFKEQVLVRRKSQCSLIPTEKFTRSLEQRSMLLRQPLIYFKSMAEFQQ